MPRKKLKLFVWHDVWTDGDEVVMLALAPDVETARRMLMAGETEGGHVEQVLSAEPEVWETPNCLKVWGES